MAATYNYIALTKPRVVLLLQITALCAVVVHEMQNSEFGVGSLETMAVVLVGGYLTAGGANAINMWYDRDIDPKMTRTANRPLSIGSVSANSALLFGIALSLIGVIWFAILSNQIAAFWASFSILFYVFVYSMWLKRRTPQNIVIGGIAGSTPPVIGWAACEDGLRISTSSPLSALDSLFDLGGLMPWFMFILIFLWTPPHFWALALYRSGEYAQVGIPMMPNVKGPAKTIKEMKVYAILLVILSLAAPMSYGEMGEDGALYHILGLTVVCLSIWYASTIWRIDILEEPDETGRIASAASSFFISMLYLAMMFVILVLASFGNWGAIFGAAATIASIGKIEFGKSS